VLLQPLGHLSVYLESAVYGRAAQPETVTNPISIAPVGLTDLPDRAEILEQKAQALSPADESRSDGRVIYSASETSWLKCCLLW
jgi:hypothetical protein